MTLCVTARNGLTPWGCPCRLAVAGLPSSGLQLDLRGADYVAGSGVWKARVGPEAKVFGKPKFAVLEEAVHFETKDMYALVPLKTDGFDMPQVTYTAWLKTPKPIVTGLGWAISQYPDHGWSRAITLHDNRLSSTSGVSITTGGASPSSCLLPFLTEG